MSVLALASAKGSPGVTTLAHRLADVLSRHQRRLDPGDRRPVVVVEADPAGGDLAARRGLAGTPGLASLALAARRSLDGDTVLAHCQQLGSVSVLAGVAGARQGAVVAPVLPGVLDSLAELGAIVLLDAGRLGPPPENADSFLLGRADVVALVMRAPTEAIIHARSAVDSLRALSVTPELVLVGRSDYRTSEIATAVGASVLGVVADSPGEAAMDPRRSIRGRHGELARSIETLASAVADRLLRGAPDVLPGPRPGLVTLTPADESAGAGAARQPALVARARALRDRDLAARAGVPVEASVPGGAAVFRLRPAMNTPVSPR